MGTEIQFLNRKLEDLATQQALVSQKEIADLRNEITQKLKKKLVKDSQKSKEINIFNLKESFDHKTVQAEKQEQPTSEQLIEHQK